MEMARNIDKTENVKSFFRPYTLHPEYEFRVQAIPAEIDWNLNHFTSAHVSKLRILSRRWVPVFSP